MAVMAMIFIVILTIGWNNKLNKIIGAAGLVLILGGIRFQINDNSYLAGFYGKAYLIEGVVAEEPDVRSDKTLLTLDKLIIESKPLNVKLLLTTQRYPEYEYGDKLKFRGKITEPKDGRAGEFSYKNYLSRFGVEGLVYYPSVLEAEPGFGSLLKTSLLGVKHNFLSGISSILSEPQNSLLAGILVGLRRGIPEDLLNDFNTTGTTHIIALSGFNITIIAAGLDFLLLHYFGRRLSFILSLIAIALFVVLTGASASVVRAGIMGILGLLALNIGRLYAINNALAFTAAAMIFINPKILHFDVGFHLSFLALLGIVYLNPVIEKYLTLVPLIVRPYLAATISAQVFTIPVLLYNFDRLSLIAPIANILVLPVVPPLMLFGFLSGTVALISEVIALPLVWLSWLMLTYIIKVTEWLASIPLASFTVSDFHIIGVVIYYLCLLSLLVIYYNEDILKKVRLVWMPTQKNT